MKYPLPLTVIALASLTGSTALALPLSMTLVLDAIVTSNSFTPEMDAIEGVGTKFSTVSVGDPFTVVASLDTDPGFLNVPDFGTDMGTIDGTRVPIEESSVFDRFGTLLGWEGFVWASLEKAGNTLTADTLSGPNVFDLRLAMDTAAWSGIVSIIGQFEDGTTGENNFDGSLRGSIIGARVTGPGQPVPDTASTVVLLALGLAATGFAARRLNPRATSNPL